ncbi:MAG: response regulator transcription factor [Bacteroidota bacterium]
MPRSIRVVLADDHPVFLNGLATFLREQDDLVLAGTATDGRAALDLTRRERPDVLVLDLEMPEMTGIAVAEALQGEATQVLILSAYQDQDYIFGALEHGAAGYLIKREPLSTILDAIRGVAGGETGWLSRRIADLVRRGRWRRRSEPHLLAPLSPREREVAVEVARGRSNAEIAEALFISLSTVKKHVNAVFEKLDLPTRPRVVAWMWEHGLVEPETTTPPS